MCRYYHLRKNNFPHIVEIDKMDFPFYETLFIESTREREKIIHLQKITTRPLVKLTRKQRSRKIRVSQRNNELSPNKIDIMATSFFFHHWHIPFTRFKLGRCSPFAPFMHLRVAFKNDRVTELCATWSMRDEVENVNTDFAGEKHLTQC